MEVLKKYAKDVCAKKKKNVINVGRNAVLEEMLKKTLNKPIVITKEQLKNIMIFVKETDDGIETISLEDYLSLKIIDKLLTLLNRGE